ncbi:MAG: hypothetical protein ACRDS0_28180 [Pseudonocardiaceae bacterium]
MTSAVEYRRELASALVSGGAARSPWLRRAFEETPREVFVPRFHRWSEPGQKVLIDGTDPAQRAEWLRGSWFTAGLHPDGDGLCPVAQGGPQRLWDTVESCHALWRRLGEPHVGQFGVTADQDPDLQYVWLDHPDAQYRWPLPL